MPGPTRNDILIGFFFVIFGLILVLCDEWASRMVVVGLPVMKAHKFNHVFFVWTLKQILLACLLLLWKAIDSNWIGMGRFRHAEFADRRQNFHQNIPILQGNENQNNRRVEDIAGNADNHAVDGNGAQAIHEEFPGQDNENEGNGQQNLAPVNQPRPYRRRPKKYTKLLFFLPAVFNQANIILMYFGTRLTYPSSIIMLKGTQPIFVFLLALAFLAQQIAVYMWFGVIVVAIGLAISGLSDYIHIIPDGYEPYGIAAGDLLFTMGQITLATQMIYEEKFMRKLSIHPMKFLGSEGVYSMVFSFICLIIFNCVDTNQYTELPNYRIEDIHDAIVQLGNSWKLIIAVLGSLLSYVIFMYLGMLIIKEHGAMARVMIAMLSWTFFWAISLGIKWQNYYITQVPGLVMVLCGLLLYFHILVIPCFQGNNMAGEIGPNFIDEVNGDDDADELGNLPPEEEPPNGDDNDRQNYHHDDPCIINGEEDDAYAANAVGEDQPLLHA